MMLTVAVEEMVLIGVYNIGSNSSWILPVLFEFYKVASSE